MNKGRMEAFSDGVIAVIITIMVLDLKVPHGGSLADLRPLLPVFFSYVLSFTFVGLYWANHHHLLQGAKRINGTILWANLHLLFWLSLAPFATAWMGDHPKDPWPFAVYGLILLLAAFAYSVLTKILIKHHGSNSILAASIGKDLKGRVSVWIYIASIPLAFVRTWISGLCWVVVALMWLYPDRRIENALARLHSDAED